jgi:hypothetical protein
MDGRTDLKEYQNGLSQMLNFTPMRTGGASKRPGSIFVREVTGLGSDATGGAALIPFIVNKTEAYVIAIKNNNTSTGFIKVYRNDDAGTEITPSPFVSLNSPLASLDPKGYSYAQAGDLLFLAHNSGTVEPLVVFRQGENLFGVTSYAAAIGIPTPTLPNTVLRSPYRPPNITSTTINPSGTSGSITLSASADLFNIGHINSLWKIKHGSVEGIVRITGVSSATVAQATVLVTLGGSTATTDWQEGSWSSFRGFPKAVAIFEERLFWAGSTSEPDRVWGSLSQNLFHMMQLRLSQDNGSSTDVSGLNYFGDLNNADPVTFLLGSNDANSASFLASGNSLFAGTLGAEYIVDGGDTIIGLESGKPRRQTSHGSQPGKVANLNNEVVFITRDGRSARNFRFSRENGSFVSTNLSKIADHIHRQGTKNTNDIYNTSIEELAEPTYQQARETIWFTTTNNELVALTFTREEPIIAWSRYAISGTDVSVWGICAVPSSDGIFDNLYMLVERTIDGSTKYYLEYLKADWDLDSLEDESDVVDNFPVWLDSAKVITLGTGISSITGLSHLEGETVRVVKNGRTDLGTFTVAAGAITLPSATTESTRFVVGLDYEAIMDTMRLEAGQNFQTSKGSIQRIDRCDLLLYKTADVKVGAARENAFLEEVKFADVFTGTKRVNVTMSPDVDNRLRVKSDKPFPCTILGLSLRGVTND